MDVDVSMSTASQLQIPVFPLPDVVLFPGAILPLRVFESRYLQLVKDVLGETSSGIALPAGRQIGMPQIKPEAVQDIMGSPALLPIMGVGEIVAQEAQDDGTWHIALLGKGRYRIKDEIPHSPYRIADAELLEDQVPRTPEGLAFLARESASLLSLGRTLIAHSNVQRPSLDQINRTLQKHKEPGALSDFLGGLFVQDSPTRQRLLECSDVMIRTQLVKVILKNLIDESGIEPGDSLPDDICLN